MSKEVYTYGFSKEQKWPEGIRPIPVDTASMQILGWPFTKWPSGPFLVHYNASKEFVSKVAGDKPGKLRTAVIVPQGEWVPPERHLAYFDKRIQGADKEAILDFVGQEKQP